MTDIVSKLTLDGQLVPGQSESEVIDPATGEAFATAGRASRDQALTAIAAAHRAQPSWATLGWEQRGRLLVRYATLLDQHREQLAEIVVLEQGKPLSEALGEIAAAAQYTRHFAELRLDVTQIPDPKNRVTVSYEPLGVVAGINPWNFPVLSPMAKLASALITGNTIVLKAAPSTPLSALFLGSLGIQVFPPGVVNVVADNNDLGPLLTSHRDVAKVVFTGSTATGRAIMSSGAANLKRLTLELGGNDAAIVHRDVDVATTADRIYRAAFYNAGQACLAIKRVYVHKDIYTDFCEAMAGHARRAIQGPGMTDGVEIGPVQNRQQFDKAQDYLDVARKDGQVLCGGTTGQPGYFVSPTIVANINDSSRLVEEEQFCPILPVLSVADPEKAMERANSSDFGLGGSVWAGDLDYARDLAGRMQAGSVWVNQHLSFGPHIPFAGAKQSGIGVKNGTYGLSELCQLRVINEAPAI